MNEVTDVTKVDQSKCSKTNSFVIPMADGNQYKFTTQCVFPIAADRICIHHKPSDIQYAAARKDTTRARCLRKRLKDPRYTVDIFKASKDLFCGSSSSSNSNSSNGSVVVGGGNSGGSNSSSGSGGGNSNSSSGNGGSGVGGGGGGGSSGGVVVGGGSSGVVADLRRDYFKHIGETNTNPNDDDMIYRVRPLNIRSNVIRTCINKNNMSADIKIIFVRTEDDINTGKGRAVFITQEYGLHPSDACMLSKDAWKRKNAIVATSPSSPISPPSSSPNPPPTPTPPSSPTPSLSSTSSDYSTHTTPPTSPHQSPHQSPPTSPYQSPSSTPPASPPTSSILPFSLSHPTPYKAGEDLYKRNGQYFVLRVHDGRRKFHRVGMYNKKPVMDLKGMYATTGRSNKVYISENTTAALTKIQPQHNTISLPSFYPVMGDELRDRIKAFKTELECNASGITEENGGVIYHTNNIIYSIYYFVCYDHGYYKLQLHGLGHIEYVKPLFHWESEIFNDTDLEVKNKDILIIK